MPLSSHRMSEATSGQSLRYPLEYFSAPLAFASQISQVTGAPLWECVAAYTPLHEELTGASFQEALNEALLNTLLNSSLGESWHELAQVAYALYQEQPYAAFDARWIPKGSTRFGALGVDTSSYNLSRNQVKLHFLPTRQAGSDLASSRLAERRADMKRPQRECKIEWLSLKDRAISVSKYP
jgi:hypothetical protein